mmetsp:Transcript_29144/g.58144  ORF Transcript_29144/g.58144 Transcript_29144/m.58144 type:complete len:676 (+) Transcript_29144:53-2080(+)
MIILASWHHHSRRLHYRLASSTLLHTSCNAPEKIISNRFPCPSLLKRVASACTEAIQDISRNKFHFTTTRPISYYCHLLRPLVVHPKRSIHQYLHFDNFFSTLPKLRTMASTPTKRMRCLPGPTGYAVAREEADKFPKTNASESFVRYVENRPYLPLLDVDPSSEESILHVAKSVLLARRTTNELAPDQVRKPSKSLFDVEEDEKKDGDDIHPTHNDTNVNAADEVVLLTPEDRQVTKISGGLTNALYLIGAPDSPSSVLLRVFGAEGMIDRDLETTNLARLCGTSDQGKKVVHQGIDVVGRFGNGRVETWVPGMRQAHYVDDFGSRKVSVSSNGKGGLVEDDQVEKYGGLVVEVARQLARLHYGFQTPEYLLEGVEVGRLQPTLWKVIRSWINELSHNLSHEHFQLDSSLRKLFYEGTTGKQFLNNGESASRQNNSASKNSPIFIANEMICYLSDQLKWVQSLIDEQYPDAPIGFCHNDVNAGNILVNASVQDAETSGKHENDEPYNAETVCLIDYEYCSINYTMYDIANFFNEHTGGNDNGIPNYALYPSVERQCHFLEAYLRERDFIDSKTHGGNANTDANVDANDDPVKDISSEITHLQSQVEIFQMINSLYWGIWGIVQAAEEVRIGTFRVDDARSRMMGEIDGDEWDYLKYGRNRLERFRDCKGKMMRC